MTTANSMAATSAALPANDSGDSSRIITREICSHIFDRAGTVASKGGTTEFKLFCWWSGELRWARNRVSLASDRRDMLMAVKRTLPGGGVGMLWANQFDDASLELMMREVERKAQGAVQSEPPDMRVDPPSFDYKKSLTWSDNTFDASFESRGELSRTIATEAEAEGFLSAGYIEMRAGVVAQSTEAARPSLDFYQSQTQAQCSTTVRHPKGTGSGWAGLSGFDWAKIDVAGIAKQALTKCRTSLDPVRIEPGRYTVILEPQAVSDFLSVLWTADSFSRRMAEQGGGPFALGADYALRIYRTKLGLKLVDERVTLSHDLTDPQLGVMPMSFFTREPVLPITWIERGVLKTLTYSRTDTALPKLNGNLPALEPGSFRMSGGDTSIEEMIATTKRGLLVTRFSNLAVIDNTSALATGTTRDGLWLVENGKIAKAVQNMRITESPLFMLNQIDQLGVPVPVFRPDRQVRYWPFPNLRSAIVPPIKANDFSFTATIDAI